MTAVAVLTIVEFARGVHARSARRRSDEGGPQPRQRPLRDVLTVVLVVLLGLAAASAPFVFRMWKAAGEREQPAEPFRIAGYVY